uniref:(California timema) hypothetical protein n=1 Tax=Timema californicum TaxID=61474 RepID=A0A7R9P5Y9_TIMCA|nr:unnamed protein product [Timema californicum]
MQAVAKHPGLREEVGQGYEGVHLANVEIHARTNALAVTFFQNNGSIIPTSSLGIYPECSPCGWEVSGWRLRSEEYVTSEPTLIIRENELDGCRYDVLQVDNGNENHPTDIQGKLTSHRGDGGDSWQIKAMRDQRIKLVFENSAKSDSAALGYPRNPGYRVELKPSPLREFDDIQLPSEAVVSNGYQMQVDLQKFDVYKEFSATYSFESKHQLTLTAESGTIRGPVFIPMSERLCVAILFRAAPFQKPIRYSNPRSRLVESREDYDYTPSEDTRLTVTLQLLDGTEINVGTVEAPEKMEIHVGAAQTPEVGHILLQKMEIHVETVQTPEVGHILLQKMDIHVGTVQTPEVGHILLQKMDIHVGTAQTPEVGYILLQKMDIHVGAAHTPEVGYTLLQKMDIHVGTAQTPEVDKWIYQRFVIELQPEHQQRDMAYVITAGQKVGAKLFVRKIEECDPEGNNGKCINGGVLSKDSNECICPPGFRGFFCEDGCGVNKYGDDCGGKCSSFRRGCKGLVMCKEKIGCDCAPGFQGQLCDTPCDPGHYGFGCKQTCGHCAGKLCDSFSGSCFSGCENGYFAPLCFYTVPSRSLPSHFYLNGRGAVVRCSSVVPKPAATAELREEGGNSGDFMVLEIWLASEQGNFELTMLISVKSFSRTKYKYLSTAPIAEPVSADTIQVYFSVDHTQGRGSPRFYKLQHKKNGEAAWIDHYPKTLPRDYVTTNITGLKTWTWYDIRVILIDLNLNSYEGYDIPLATARTKCILPSNVDYHLQSPSASENSFQVSWKYDQQVRWCPLTNFEVYLRDGWRWVLSKRTHESMANFSDVLPGREHKVKLRAMTVNGPASFSKTLSIVTSDQVVPPDPSLTPVTNRTSTSFVVHWNHLQNCTGINGFLNHYHYEMVNAEEENQTIRFSAEGNTENTYIGFYGLKPKTHYTVKVYHVTSGGWNRKTPLVIHARTRPQESDILASDYDQVEEESNENLYSVESSTAKDWSLLYETSSNLNETGISDVENYYESNASDKETNEFENSSGEELNQHSDENSAINKKSDEEYQIDSSSSNKYNTGKKSEMARKTKTETTTTTEFFFGWGSQRAIFNATLKTCHLN